MQNRLFCSLLIFIFLYYFVLRINSPIIVFGRWQVLRENYGITFLRWRRTYIYMYLDLLTYMSGLLGVSSNRICCMAFDLFYGKTPRNPFTSIIVEDGVGQRHFLEVVNYLLRLLVGLYNN